ncbi:MAG: glutathione peroxidase [Bacteroidetes bacterium]|nr:glutathione peroxidase [Bacteroidota bacterium]
MFSLLPFLGQLIYPIRKSLNKLFDAGVVVSNNNLIMNPTKSIYDYKIEGIDGKEIDFSAYKGKKILLVNTASECGFTPQYDGLQKLSEKFRDVLVVIGLPSNNFGAQEPGGEEEILSFCQTNYGVTFPLTKKIDVVGNNKHDIFRWLTTKELNGWNEKDPNWNFCKYLISENGNLLHFFSHKMDPMDPKIIARINEASSLDQDQLISTN